MAISGTYAAGDYESVKSWLIGLDIAASATYVDVSTWVTNFRISRNARTVTELISHGAITETVTGTLPNVDVEIDVFYDMALTGPAYNMIALMEGASQSCNVKLTESNLTTPASGDITYELTSAVIVNVSEPDFDQNGDADVPIATLSFNGTLATTVTV